MQAQDFPTCRLPEPPGSGIFCVGLRIDGDAAWFAALHPFVAEEERQEARRYVRERDAIRHLAGRALVRRLLPFPWQGALLTAFSLTPWGKPYFPGLDGDFSISHSGDLVLVAFCATAAVGVDVEHVRALPDLARLMGCLHPEESAALEGLPPEERQAAFYRCWTRKEAVLKAAGTGLGLPLNGFQVSPGPEKEDWLLSLPARVPAGGQASDAGGICGWTSLDLALGKGYQGSVAAKGPDLACAFFML